MSYNPDVRYSRGAISITIYLYALCSCGWRALDNLPLRQAVHLLSAVHPWLDLFGGFLDICSILECQSIVEGDLSPFLVFLCG